MHGSIPQKRTTYEMKAMIRGYHVYTTEIALEGTALASWPFGAGSCESW